MTTPHRKTKTSGSNSRARKRGSPSRVGRIILPERVGLVVHAQAPVGSLLRAILSVQGSHCRVQAVRDVTITRVAGQGGAVQEQPAVSDARPSDILTVKAGTVVRLVSDDYAVFEAIEVPAGTRHKPKPSKRTADAPMALMPFRGDAPPAMAGSDAPRTEAVGPRTQPPVRPVYPPRPNPPPPQ